LTLALSFEWEESVMHDPSRVRVSGPLEVFASGFAGELARLGYRRVPVVFQLQLMAHASRWLRGEGLGAGELSSEVVERFLAERRAAGYTNYVTGRAMAPLLGYLVASESRRQRRRASRSARSRCCWPTIGVPPVSCTPDD
jgi:hypothetical protein